MDQGAEKGKKASVCDSRPFRDGMASQSLSENHRLTPSLDPSLDPFPPTAAVRLILSAVKVTALPSQNPFTEVVTFNFPEELFHRNARRFLVVVPVVRFEWP